LPTHKGGNHEKALEFSFFQGVIFRILDKVVGRIFMFGSDVLEVAIGLVFIYLMLALLTTAVTEALSRALAMRSSTLLEGIQNMLSGNMTVEKDGECETVAIWIEFYNNPLVKKLAKRKREELEVATRGWARGKGLASYIDQRTFSLALFDILFTKNGKYVADLRTELAKLPGDVQKPLLALLNEANDDLGKFREGVETWFNEHMERVTGWYRRKARLIAFGLGALVALLVNADTIAITNGLMRDATLRDVIVESAGALVWKRNCWDGSGISKRKKWIFAQDLLRGEVGS
jgi:hypothetical protein